MLIPAQIFLRQHGYFLKNLNSIEPEPTVSINSCKTIELCFTSLLKSFLLLGTLDIYSLSSEGDFISKKVFLES